MMGHWNSWFDGILYMNNPDKYPLQSYLQLLLERSKVGSVTIAEAQAAADLASKRSIYVAEMFLAMVPVLMVYPYLQKYFTTGIVLGSVKG
jgi:ABC-type sugar transport system, permease component